MAQSLASVAIHLIFSTKGRQPVLRKEIRAELYGCIATLANQMSSSVYEAGGVEDHVHVLLTLPRTMALAKLVEFVKKESSKWIKKQDPALRLFAWQNGYGAFSVSASKIAVVRRYILNQEQHHQKRSFEDELTSFLVMSNTPFIEQYLFD